MLLSICNSFTFRAMICLNMTILLTFFISITNTNGNLLGNLRKERSQNHIETILKKISDLNKKRRDLKVPYKLCEYDSDIEKPLYKRPITRKLVSKYKQKSQLNLTPGDIVQFDGPHVALFLGKEAGKKLSEILGVKEYATWEIVVHSIWHAKDNVYAVKVHDWTTLETKDPKKIYRLNNSFEDKYASFSLDQMVNRVAKWVNCIPYYSYYADNCQHFVHKVKHGVIVSQLQEELDSYANDSNPEIPDSMNDDCTKENSWESFVNKCTPNIHPEADPTKFKPIFNLTSVTTRTTLKVVNYPNLGIELMAAYTDAKGNLSTTPNSSLPHITSLLTKIDTLNKSNAKMSLCCVVRIVKNSLTEFLATVLQLFEAGRNDDFEWVQEQRKKQGRPILFMDVTDSVGQWALYNGFRAKKCFEEKIVNRLWRLANRSNNTTQCSTGCTLM